MLDLKRSRLISHILLISLGIVPLADFTTARAQEILIDNRESLATTIIAAPLVTIRPVTTKRNQLLANTRITKDLIIQSATAFPEIQAQLKNLGVSDPASMQMADLVTAIQSSEYPNRYLYETERRPEEDLRHPVAMSRYAQNGQHIWDAKTLINMVVTGVIDTDNVNSSTIDGNTVEWFSIGDKYAYAIDNIYRGFWSFEEEAPPADVGRIFTSLRDDVTQYDALQRSMLENIGQITFGMPIVYTATEKDLHIPASILKSFDVYWADLVVTYYGVDPADLAELAFNVAVPEGSVALKLVPLRFGVEIAQTEEESIPEVGVEYGGMKVSVGEYFSRTVAYRYLKPTIEAYGEGQRNFSWKMEDEAINPGSHRFAAVLGVPKGAVDVDLAFSGHVRLKKSFIGEWYDGELVAGTGTWVVPVSF